MEGIENIEKKIDLRKFNGGARKGAGMPLGKKTKKTFIKEAAQMYLIRQVEENIAEITAALMQKAKEGDIQGIKEAFDRAWGKSRERVDMTVHKPIPLDVVHENLRVPEDKEPQ